MVPELNLCDEPHKLRHCRIMIFEIWGSSALIITENITDNIMSQDFVAPTVTAKIIPILSVRSPDSVQITRKIRLSVEHKMSYLFDGLMLNVIDALFEEVHGKDTAVGLKQQFNISRALRVNASDYRKRFTVLMNMSWDSLLKSDDCQVLPAPSEDVAVILKAYSNRNLHHYKILLEELRQRFSLLVDADLSFHPLLPANFYLCFWYATEKLDLEIQERKLLLTLYNRFVMDRFGQVLAIANQKLTEFDFVGRERPDNSGDQA